VPKDPRKVEGIELIHFNKKTPAGRIYTKSEIEKAFRRFFSKHTDLLVVNKIDDEQPYQVILSNVIGTCKKNDCQITKTAAFLNITFINDQMAKDCNLLISSKKADIFMFGEGIVVQDKVKNYQLSFIYLQLI